MHRDDVRVLELCRDENLALEALHVHAGRELGREDFDDDFPPQCRLLGHENTRHSAAAELALERIGGAERSLQFGAKVHARIPTETFEEVRSMVLPAGRSD